MASYGWFNPKVINDQFTGGLVHPVDSVVPGSVSAIEIAEHAHHAHHLAMYVSIAVAVIGIFFARQILSVVPELSETSTFTKFIAKYGEFQY